LEHGGKVYSATLNQTSVQNNNNKFYIIQLIQSSANSQQVWFYTRWGRVGVPGQLALDGPYNLPMAVGFYNRKFNEKHNQGNYREVQLNYENEEE
jgi:poly [ADP-ribose] polymerase